MGKIDRRTFLKFGIGGALFSCEAVTEPLTKKIQKIKEPATKVLGESKSVSRTSQRVRKAIPTTCYNCSANCGIYGFTEYGRVVKIEGVPENPNNRGKTCGKGQAGLNMVYDEERLLTPLKRTGARGKGRWEQISWEQALDEITNRLKELKEKGTPEQLVFEAEGSPMTELIARRFLNAFGSPNAVVHSRLGNENKITAQRLTWGANLEVPDVSNSNYILLFGSNPYESHPLYINLAQRIVEARMKNKAKVIVFDVRLTQTSAKSDTWYPINPGSDAAIALAMCNVIIEEGLADVDFINNWTNYPFEKLKAYLKKYTPETAEIFSGVSASDIREIARQFATFKPSIAISGGGVTKHENGVYTERCIMLLNAVAGNIDVKGGYCLPRTYALKEPEPVPPAVDGGTSAICGKSEDTVLDHASRQGVLSSIKEGKQKVGVYMLCEYNPAYSSPECQHVSALLRDESKIPFFVAIDTYMTETAALADIVLPYPTYLERSDIFSPPSFSMVPMLSLCQPVVNPVGESKSLYWITSNLANKLGEEMQTYFRFGEDIFLQAAIHHFTGLTNKGGIFYLMQHGLWYDTDAKPRYKLYEEKGFNTSSGKFEIFSELLARKGFNPLPTYDPIHERSVVSNGKFILVPFSTSVHTADRTAGSVLLSEVVHDNPLWMNAEVAHKLKLKEEDKVVVISKSGRLITRLRTSQGVHPNVVAMATNCGHWEFGRVARAKNFKTKNPETSLIWWEKEGNGVNPAVITPPTVDPIGGGQGWMDTIVEVKKV
ncbi:MAG TPA: molybdopterin-containing oxidoreductase family protein [Candidatus Brocadiia bacterium]|nr:molybdopterin-dependent oxidoreductase [Candidatus Brocadiales bacterium]